MEDRPEDDAPEGLDLPEPDTDPDRAPDPSPDSERASKWRGDPGSMSIVFPQSQCNFCIHRNGESSTCTAYPEGIPLVIFTNEHDHRFPWPGDDGVTFDQDPDAELFDHETDLLTEEELEADTQKGKGDSP